MLGDQTEEDPQVRLRRPSRLFVNQPATQQRSPEPAAVVSPNVGVNWVNKTASAPQVQALSAAVDSPEAATVSQEYVNKVVQSLGAVRSALVNRSPPPVLRERSLR